MTEIKEELCEEVEDDEEETGPNFMSNFDWIKTRKEYLKMLKDFKKFKDCDRLDMSRIFTDSHFMLMESATAWMALIKTPHVMALIPEKDTKEFVATYVDLVEKYIQLDVKFTESVEKFREKGAEQILKIEPKKPVYSV
jgi:hypothetical protein